MAAQAVLILFTFKAATGWKMAQRTSGFLATSLFATKTKQQKITTACFKKGFMFCLKYSRLKIGTINTPMLVESSKSSNYPQQIY